jgi:hypothetical protein
VAQGKKIFSLSLGIESRPKGLFKPVEQAPFPLDPKDHRRAQRIEIEEPSTEFHASSFPSTAEMQRPP